MRSPLSVLTLAFLLVHAPECRPQQATLPLEKKVYRDAAGKSLPYRLLAPTKLEPGRKYPLVLFLHGAGERGTDNDKQLVHGVPVFASAENRKKYPCFLVAPQCPTGARWVEVDWGGAAHRQPAEPSAPMQLTLKLLETLTKELPIDSRRIYVTGLSMGGFGTWDIVSRRPNLFAAAVPICGGGDEATAKRIAKVPVWVFHGGKDGVVKPSRSRNMVEAVRKAGGEPKYTEYPNEGHGSWGPAYRDPELLRWLFAQRRP